MYPCMKLKHLQSNLQSIRMFDRPKAELEQYHTPVHLASEILHSIQSEFNDLNGKIVADLGCGSGVLTVGSVILDADFVVGFEIDDDALEICKENLVEYEMNNVDLVQIDVTNADGFDRWHDYFHTVIMNPPFGTKNNEGIDMAFLRAALKICSGSVYSLHKTSTRNYIQKYCDDNEIEARVIAELKYDIAKTFKFHKKKTTDIFVDLYRLRKKSAI